MNWEALFVFVDSDWRFPLYWSRNVSCLEKCHSIQSLVSQSTCGFKNQLSSIILFTKVEITKLYTCFGSISSISSQHMLWFACSSTLTLTLTQSLSFCLECLFVLFIVDSHKQCLCFVLFCCISATEEWRAKETQKTQSLLCSFSNSSSFKFVSLTSLRCSNSSSHDEHPTTSTISLYHFKQPIYQFWTFTCHFQSFCGIAFFRKLSQSEDQTTCIEWSGTTFKSGKEIETIKCTWEQSLSTTSQRDFFSWIIFFTSFFTTSFCIVIFSQFVVTERFAYSQKSCFICDSLATVECFEFVNKFNWQPQNIDRVQHFFKCCYSQSKVTLTSWENNEFEEQEQHFQNKIFIGENSQCIQHSWEKSSSLTQKQRKNKKKEVFQNIKSGKVGWKSQTDAKLWCNYAKSCSFEYQNWNEWDNSTVAVKCKK